MRGRFYNEEEMDYSDIDGGLRHKSADTEKMYYSGKSVFWFTSFPASIFDYPEITENTEVYSAFKGTGGTAVRTFSFRNALLAFLQTKYSEEAKKFVKWWAENYSALYTEGGCWAYPATKSFFSDEVTRIQAEKIQEAIGYYTYKVYN